jgi:hypothetical protein
MAISINEQGQVKINGRYVRKPDMSARETVNKPPKAISRLEYAMSFAGFDQKHDIHMTNVSERDDRYVREALAHFEDELREAFVKALTPAVAKVKNVMADKRYTMEAKRNEALEAIAPARAEWVKAANKFINGLIFQLRETESFMTGALMPEFEETVSQEVIEARARECREAVLNLGEVDRVKLLLALGQRAALEPLHALKSDPLKREAAQADVLTQAREAAIMAQDGEWILFEWRQQQRILETAGARLATMEHAMNQGFKAMGLSEHEGDAAQWTRHVHRALEQSAAVLV